jgi:hypothetical protein
MELERIIATKELLQECTKKRIKLNDKRVSSFIPYFNLDEE